MGVQAWQLETCSGCRSGGSQTDLGKHGVSNGTQPCPFLNSVLQQKHQRRMEMSEEEENPPMPVSAYHFPLQWGTEQPAGEPGQGSPIRTAC